MANSQVVDTGYQHPFVDGTTYLLGVGEEPRTLCELAMTRFSAELRSIENWWILHQDENVRNAWLEAGMARSWKVGHEATEVKLSKHQIAYVLDELAGYASLRDENTGIIIRSQVSSFDRIWECDTLLCASEEDIVKRAMNELREHCQSLTPGISVRDVLVDPFRHCYVFGRSFNRTSKELVIPEDDNYYSRRFSVLPTEVEIPWDSPTLIYKSYINGIDPALANIYDDLGLVLKRLIKLFEQVLTSLHRSNPLPQRIVGSYTYKVWDEPEPPEDSDDDESWVQYHRDTRHWELHRPVELPDIPEEGYQGQLTHILHRVSLNDRSVQVVHKIVDIIFDDERRGIPDESWHVEGMKNERIAACALYFLRAEGIDKAQLEFRMAVTMPNTFRANDAGATSKTWGLRDNDPCRQYIGTVPVRSGLAISFPNIYQHRLRRVQLADDRTEGRLTILAFFLIDPDIPPILSTMDVPPQQRDWIFHVLQESLDFRLPTEVVERIASMVDSLFSEDETECYQREMQTERHDFAEANSMNFFSVPFNIALGQGEQ